MAGVDAVLLQPTGQLAGVGLHLHRIGSAHKRIMGWRYLANHPLCGQLPQPVEREDDIPVFLKPGPVEIDRDMADQQISRFGVSGDAPVNRHPVRETGSRPARQGRPKKRSPHGAVTAAIRSPRAWS
jgi:hypothetical protein